jgi:hypothetical protein
MLNRHEGTVKAAFWRFAHSHYQTRKPLVLAEIALFGSPSLPSFTAAPCWLDGCQPLSKPWWTSCLWSAHWLLDCCTDVSVSKPRRGPMPSTANASRLVSSNQTRVMEGYPPSGLLPQRGAKRSRACSVPRILVENRAQSIKCACDTFACSVVGAAFFRF